MPALMGSPFISSLKKQVARGPVTAEVRMAGSQIRGFFTMLGICSMEVPMPWLTSPPQRFSRKERTANPTMLAQHPATAAAPRQARQPQHGADGGGGDGQRQGDAHQHGHQHPHPEGLQLRGVHDELAEGTGRPADGGAR